MNAPSIKNRVPLQNGKRTGKQGKAVPTLLLAAVQILLASHSASKVAWSHFALVVASAKKKTTSGAGEREKLKIQEAPPLL